MFLSDLTFGIVICFVFFMDSLFLKFICNSHTVLSFLSLSLLVGGCITHLCFDLRHCRVSKLCNWCVGRLEVHEIMLLKEEEMYMLEETVNAGLGAGSLSADTRPSSPSTWLDVVGWSGRQFQLFLIDMYIVFFWKSMEIGSKMLEMGEKCSWA